MSKVTRTGHIAVVDAFYNPPRRVIIRGKGRPDKRYRYPTTKSWERLAAVIRRRSRRGQGKVTTYGTGWRWEEDST